MMLHLVVLLLAATLVIAEGTVIVYTREIPHGIVEEFRDMPASFGGDLPLEGLRGFLTVGEPEDGCKPIAKPPLDDNFTGNWIVILGRYNCSFETKIRNAQEAGFACAIVHNVNSSDLETMSANNSSGIVIPSVFVSELAGTILEGAYTYNTGYYLVVNSDLPFNINTHLLLPFAIVVALCLLVMMVFMIVKCIKDRRRARRHRLPNRALKKIPTCKFSKGDPYDTCAICLDDYLEGERLRVLPCAHAYHAKCIDPWLTQNRRVCPVCKRRVLSHGERRRFDSDTDSDSSREPLAPSDHENTQGGTFDEQSENPFVRAARFMTRLRARRSDNVEQVTQPDEPSNENNEENETIDDTQPLIQPTVQVERERRRTRRSRNRVNRLPADDDSQSDLRSETPSINQESGEIGVAALPAPHIDTNIRL